MPLPVTCGRIAKVPVPFAARGIVKTPERVLLRSKRRMPAEAVVESPG